MADYFTHFSIIVPLPTEAAEKYALNLAQQARRIHDDEPIPDDFPLPLHEVVEDWHFNTDASDPSNGWGLWLHTENGGIDAVCAFIQHLLERFDPDAHVALEWSNDCSKPRIDAFGGGAAIITAATIKTFSTGQWLHQQVARLQTHNPHRHHSTVHQ